MTELHIYNVSFIQLFRDMIGTIDSDLMKYKRTGFTPAIASHFSCYTAVHSFATIPILLYQTIFKDGGPLKNV